MLCVDIDNKDLFEANANERLSTIADISMAKLSPLIECDEDEEEMELAEKNIIRSSPASPETMAHDVSDYQVRDMSLCFELQAALGQLPCVESFDHMQLRIGISRAVAQLPVYVPSGKGDKHGS